MSRLTDLIARTKGNDPQLGADLEREFKALSSRLPYGLNFERHSPEAVELPLRPVRKGDKVRVLPERGSTKKGDQRLWQVKAIQKAKKLADLELLGPAKTETQSVALDDLVVVAEFRDTIYPGLVSTGKVERGGDKPFHTVINGENYHALKALTYAYRGKVDAIYIDPPYNSGAKDWKYNNDYVESDDLYRHSKWLAMMERRLLLAKDLLNPAESVLIVTIDEKEYLRLGLLLEQLFSYATIQMVSSQINPKGVSRGGSFRRSDEYLYFVMFGTARPCRMPLSSEWSTSTQSDLENSSEDGSPVTPDWTSMMRRGSEAYRNDRPSMFYPIYADPITRKISAVGAALPNGEHAAPPKKGLVAILPIRKDGSEGRWQIGASELESRIKQGRVRLGRSTSYGFVVNYLPDGAYADVISEKFLIQGYADDGSVIAFSEAGDLSRVASTQWKIASHNASENGSSLLATLLPKRKFPFPKSLYAVEDALRFFVLEKKDAVVLDFFSGSGTTAHAVMRLNRQDQGKRRCISITNNEVAADEQKALREQFLRPGDADWEKYGICDFITKPRVKAAITGKTPEGGSIKGDYKFTDEFPIADGFEENAEFFTLTYEAKSAVNHNLAYARIAPLLWLRAGAQGLRIDKLPPEGWALVNTYGLLTEVDAAAPFINAVRQAKALRVAYIVTDDDRRFQAIAQQLPRAVEPVRLYESYLTNFSFSNGE
ncbi:MAG: DNA methyltransferase [Hydrogenophaga sp.]|uniref:site-specific DNA-methyltransferase n=1 Tax=Hydrogenophaga sp. TaxID=1904254 RepID=UPI0027202E15|nr:DNA methyltransferase [Hydrogenophaga sp.]MDO9030314.1 DNA methyltransferase [Hydrogenophaga sp.]